jgi:hypothetical protein
VKQNFIVNKERPDYAALAADAIIGLLQEEYAVVWPEVEAKLSERPHPLLPGGINPHLLTNARRRLIQSKLIEEFSEVTKGGARIGVLGLVNRRRQKTNFEKTAARKRALHARYRGWALGSSRGPNMIGAAGERVTQASLRAAAENMMNAGYVLLRPEAGNINSLLGAPVSGGALDNAAHLTVLDQDSFPVVLTIPIEVKNLRGWLYPGADEIYQLIDKAVRLQQMHLSRAFVPVLVCRKAHYTTFLMARDLGFFVFQTKEQPILPHSTVSAEAIAEVRDELGYNLVQTEGAMPLITDAFRNVIPSKGREFAQRWAQVAAALATIPDVLTVLRNSQTKIADRNAALDTFHTTVMTVNDDSPF